MIDARTLPRRRWRKCNPALRDVRLLDDLHVPEDEIEANVDEHAEHADEDDVEWRPGDCEKVGDVHGGSTRHDAVIKVSNFWLENASQVQKLLREM